MNRKFPSLAGMLLIPMAMGANAATITNDEQIAAIVMAADASEINAGKLAESKGNNTEVKQFAQKMVADHSNMDKSAAALAQKTNMKPEENEVSKSLKTDGAATMKKLQGLSGAAFDKAYIDSQVKDHQTVLDTFDSTLIPNAKNAELKNMLEKGRPQIAAHLQQAMRIQKTVQ
jgi:putative membrane protein